MFEVAIVVLGFLVAIMLSAIRVSIDKQTKAIGELSIGLRVSLSQRDMPRETPGFHPYGGTSEAYQAALDRARTLSGS